MAFMIGIDIGGTFTDGVVADETGEIRTFKSPTTPADPSGGLFDAIELAAESHDVDLDGLLGATEKFTYGTTITTNIIVEGTGARTGLLTTEGFRDVLPISRIGRSHLDGDVKLERPESIVPRSRIREVPERVDSRGEVIRPIDETVAERRVDELVADEGCEALAVGFLWSYKNPDHERQVAEYAREEHGVDVTCSAEIAPLQGEYERSATAALNAYLRPNFRRHLVDLDERLADDGYAYPLMVMQSTGGLIRAAEAADRPVSTLFSGPAGAITASRFIGEQVGSDDVINVDMGGTSFDVSVITDGRFETDRVVRAGGHTVLAPQIDIHSIGAGGGSIAWIDKNRLRVGPRSAGADPGPVCYGRGGEEPTVTDADLLLGYLNPDYFVGGRLDLDERRAERVFRESLAEPLGSPVAEVAAGVRRVVDARMADAIRVLTVEKGHDPRDYTIVACGGAGPVHAMSLAGELGVSEVVVPYTASVHSAFGILASDLRYRLSTTVMSRLADVDVVRETLSDLAGRAVGVLADQGVDEEEVSLEYLASLRFGGQSHELEIAIPEIPRDAADVARLRERFERRYRSEYGRGSVFADADVELASLTAEASAESPRPVITDRDPTDEIPDAARKGRREAYFVGAGEFVETDVYDGQMLRSGNAIRGPALVERTGTTVVVHPDQVATVDPYRNVRVTTEADE